VTAIKVTATCVTSIPQEYEFVLDEWEKFDVVAKRKTIERPLSVILGPVKETLIV